MYMIDSFNGCSVVATGDFHFADMKVTDPSHRIGTDRIGTDRNGSDRIGSDQNGSIAVETSVCARNPGPILDPDPIPDP